MIDLSKRNEQERRRFEELDLLREMGVDVFPSSFDKTHDAQDILRDYSDAPAAGAPAGGTPAVDIGTESAPGSVTESTPGSVTASAPDSGSTAGEATGRVDLSNIAVAGRIMTMRRMGKASFVHLQDQSGRIQVYFKKDDLGDSYEMLKLFDIGDIIGVKGYAFRTRTGEISVHGSQVVLLTKCVTPIPVAKEETDEDGNVVRYDAFADKEQRYRKRYLDLIANPEIKETFRVRAHIISAMRRFFDDRGWLEVETPILQPIYGGATARPFVTHHNALDIALYLRIADELYLKRLIVGGFEGVYEISKNFRNEGMDRTHNPEYTAMEIYVAYKDYLWMMDMTEELVHNIVTSVHGTTDVPYSETAVSYARPFRRARMYDLLLEHTGKDLRGLGRVELLAVARDVQVFVESSASAMKILDEIFSEKVQPHLIQPTFIMDYPVEMSPLAKAHRTEAGLVERFELFVMGKEIANAFSELNDPIEQRLRLEEQAIIRADGDDEAMIVDEEFLHALEVGMPPTAGLGVGIDRLVMLLTNTDSIRDVLFFPQMRPLEAP